MMQSGILTTIDSTTGQSTGVPVKGAWINFVQNNVTKATVQTNMETGAYSVDIPLGKYTVKIAVGDVTGIQRAGQLFELKTGDKADAFHKWLYSETGSIDDDLLKQFKQISNDINASANRAESAENGAKQIEENMQNNSIGNTNGKWMKEGAYGIGVALSTNGDLLNKEVSGFYRDQSSSRGYPTSSNLNAVVLGYGKTRMNGIAFQAASNEAWIFNDQTKVFNKIVTQDTNGAIEYKSTASNGVVSKVTNIGDVKKDDYIINSGFTHFIVTRPDGLKSRWIFPFKEGINTIGEDASKSGIGLTRTEHVTFPASMPNDDRIKSLMSRGNGIYRMIGNIGTAQNPAALTMHSSDSDEEISSLIAVDMYRNRVGVAFRQNKTAPVVQGDFYTTLNTTVDTNGFIKKASPIIKLFDDHIEWNQDFKEAPIFEKVAPGTYKILNTHGLAREGWTYEKPRGKDGNTYFKIKVQKLDDGCIISVHDYFVDYEDITIIDDVGNKRTVKKQIEVLSQARDIKPEERWIDLRFFEKIYDLTNEPPVIDAPYHPLWGVEPYVPPVVEQIEEENIALLDQRFF